MLTPDRPPPEDYYQNNCRSLFEFVLRRYAHLLDEGVLAQLHHFLGASDDAQRLFARLLTRKGPLIRLDKLDYAEISDLSEAIEVLAASDLIALNSYAPADQLLSLPTKVEMPSLLRNQQPKSLRKSELILLLLNDCSDRQIHQRMSREFRWLCIANPQVWQQVRLLYFGDAVQDWSAFVMRDLGMVRYEDFDGGATRHADVQGFGQDLHYRQLSHLSHRLDDHPGLAAELTVQLADPVADRFIQSRRERTLMRIAHWYEQSELFDAAIDVYSRITSHPARERIVRVLNRRDDAESAQVWLKKIRTAPWSEEEAQFAERFGKRAAGYQPPVTEIEIDIAEDDIEDQALDLLLAPGEWGAHVENSLLRTLTGLIYWEAIFADVAGAFTNPFQFGPNDLFRPDFFAQRQQIIEHIEEKIQTDMGLTQHLAVIVERKQGLANSLVNWQLLVDITVEDILDAIPTADIRKLTHFMIRHLDTRKSGLPDLLIVHGPKDYEFVEVKGPTDQLQPGQRVWFKHLARLGIPARVLKLKLAAKTNK